MWPADDASEYPEGYEVAQRGQANQVARRGQAPYGKGISSAGHQTNFFGVEILINASLAHSYGCLIDLIEGRVPEPGYPDLG